MSTKNLPYAEDAVAVMGALVAARRREMRFTTVDFAGRVGVSRRTLLRIEQGDPGVAVGSVFTAAAVAGIPLFGSDDRRELSGLLDFVGSRLAVMPSRVAPVEASDDF